MNQNDYKTFVDAWKAANEIMPGGKVLSIPAMQMIFDALAEYPIQHVTGAIKKHIKTGRFAPTPADIIEIIADHTRTKHVGADEAWSIALASFDEHETVVWTKEIAEAKAIAQELFESGDKVAARMAFKSAYERIVKTAGRPKWFVTEGFDAQRRIDAVRDGIERGLLPREALNRYQLEAPTVTFVQLTHMAAEKSPDKEKILNGLKSIKTVLENDESEKEGIERRERERLAFEEKRRHELEKVESIIKKNNEKRVH